MKEFFNSLGQRFAPVFYADIARLFFPVRGEWLRKNYYKVLQPSSDSVEQWLIRATPKVRGKYRADMNTLKDMPKNSLRQATTERLAGLRPARQIWAVCTRGHNRGKILVLHYMPWRLRGLTWVAVDYDDAPQFCGAFQNVLSERVDNVVSETLEQIRDKLRMHEIGW